MSYDEGPLYYREIQKNAYLKRVPNETSSMLKQLGYKKVPLKPMWTLFCIHNGRTPYLEQYQEAEAPTTLSHKPVWRACLRATRHVTASVRPRAGAEHDFLIDTDNGPVRMIAPDWDTMQDWVTTLRNKLHELKILSKGENVYCAAPAAPPPRAAARDPTSPLPPTPPVPPDRVPGIELILPRPQPEEVPPEPSPPNPPPEPQVDISNWEESPQPSTSTETKQPKSVAKICGQNICLDDSILRRKEVTDSDEEFFAEVDRMHASSEDINGAERNNLVEQRNDLDNQRSNLAERSNLDNALTNSPEPRSTVIEQRSNIDQRNLHEQRINLDQRSNIVDQRSNLADQRSNLHEQRINLVDQRANVADQLSNLHEQHINLADQRNLIEQRSNYVEQPKFDFKQTVVVADGSTITKNVTKNNIREPQSTNITVIQVSNKPPHTAIPVLGPETDIFNFNFDQKPESFVNIVNTEEAKNDNKYGTVFSDGDYGHLSLTTTVNLTTENTFKPTENFKATETDPTEDSVYERLCMASTSNETAINRLKNLDKSRKSSLPNLEIAGTSEATYEYLFPNNNHNTTNIQLNVNNGIQSNGIEANGRESNGNRSTETENRHITGCVSVVSPNGRVRSVERSHSQNAYDSNGRVRENVNRRVQNNSPKRESKNEKTESVTAKPIWKRGLTELSLLTRLRGIGGRRQESPTRHGEHNDSLRSTTSPVKVVRRSRPAVRVDTARRRSSSLSNGQSPPAPAPHPSLQPLRTRQAAALRAEQRRGAAISATISYRDPPIFADYDGQVWVCWWGAWGARCMGRCGDRVAALRGTPAGDAAHARALLKHQHLVDILFHRVPLGKIYVLNRRENENIGIKLDGECNIVSIERNSPAGRAGLTPPGKWAVTEVNNRPLNLIKGGEDEMNRLSKHGAEISILIQPSALVKKLRAAIKGNKHILSIR